MIASLQRKFVDSTSSRFFFGWAIVVLAGINMFASGPGQSHTFSVFIDPISEELGISKASIAAAYGTATLGAAFLLPYIGGAFDKYGPRRMLFLLATIVGFACFFFGAAANILWLTIGFGTLRFLGQGSMMLGSANIVSHWFTAKRGFAMGLMSLGFAASMGIHPPLSGYLIDAYGWRTAWHILGIMTWVMMLPLIFLLAIDKPEKVDLRPDGEKAPAAGETVDPATGLTYAEALRSPAFYLLSAAWFMIAGLLTVMQFFQVSILSAQGFSSKAATNLFPITAMATIIAMPLIGKTFDKFRTRYLVAIALGVISIALISLTFATSVPVAFFYAAFFGISVGFMMTIFGYAWPRYFGRAHIGRIQGTGQMIGIVGASLAPFPVGFAIDQFGSPATVIYLLVVLALALAVLIVFFLRTPAGVPTPDHLE